MAKESQLAKQSIVGQSNVGQTKYCGTANLWWGYFVAEIFFQNLYFLKTPAFFKAVFFFFERATFREDVAFLNS